MGSIEKKLSYLLGTKNAIKEAIVSKGVEVTNDHTFREYASLIKNINVSGEQPSEDEYDNLNDVVFYDYDGTILYSYNKDEALALEELPELPSHGGLVCEGWNWNLDEIKKRVQECGFVDIGAIYNTYDGKTRIYINIEEYNVDTVLSFKFSQSIANGFTINWGDGSNEEEYDVSGKISANHKYSSVGKYVITITVKSDCILTLGDSGIIGSSSDVTNKEATIIERIHVGDRNKVVESSFRSAKMTALTIPNSIIIADYTKYLFGNMSSIRFLAIPRTVSSSFIYDYTFSNDKSLKIISFPYSVVSAYTDSFSGASIKRLYYNVSYGNAYRVFYNNRELLYVTIATSRYAFLTNSFANCISLKKINMRTFYNTTTIGNTCFMNCYNLPYIDWSIATAVPTLSNVNAFQGCSSQLKHIVPDDLYDTWIAATNWSSFANNIIKKSDWDASQA